eukprot:3133192-Rhodomonas_salina.4
MRGTCAFSSEYIAPHSLGRCLLLRWAYALAILVCARTAMPGTAIADAGLLIAALGRAPD